MERQKIVEHVRISLSVILDREVPDFTPGLRLLEDLELNSMRFLELLVTLEDTLGLEIDPDGMEPELFQSADSLVDYIQGRLEQAEARA